MSTEEPSHAPGDGLNSILPEALKSDALVTEIRPEGGNTGAETRRPKHSKLNEIRAIDDTS